MAKRSAWRNNKYYGQRFNGRVFRPYTTTIGELVLAWNDLHEVLALIFVSMIGRYERNELEKHFHGEFELHIFERYAGIWSSASYDRPKREMLKALLNPSIAEAVPTRPKFIEDVKWILGEASGLEEIRNFAVHSPFRYGPFKEHEDMADALTALRDGQYGVVPNVLMKNKRALEMAAKDHSKQEMLRKFRWARDYILVLRDFAMMITMALTFDESPWPRRPDTPNRGQTKRSSPRRRVRPAK